MSSFENNQRIPINTERHRQVRHLAFRMVQEQEHKPTCSQCEYAFEHLNGYDSFVCDIDAHTIQLNTMSDACPLRPLPLADQEAA